ncbi:MAG: hypothetical protein ACK4MF_02275, partial [Hyphomicrobiaceae bacterium]
MRTLHRLQTVVIARSATVALAGLTLAAVAAPAAAQFNNGGNPYYYSNQTYSYGLHLPQVPVQHGQDEVRGADGTTCRSSMGNNSAYLDVGAIGSQGYSGEVDQGTFYGRVIIPLGETPKRIDCTQLYDLEIRRLKHELELARAGSGSFTPTGMADSGPGRPLKLGAAGGQMVQTSGPADKAMVVPSSAGSAAKSKSAGKPSKGGKSQAWAEEGWSNTGWQQPSRLGAPSNNHGVAAANLETAALPPPVRSYKLPTRAEVAAARDAAEGKPEADPERVEPPIAVDITAGPQLNGWMPDGKLARRRWCGRASAISDRDAEIAGD